PHHATELPPTHVPGLHEHVNKLQAPGSGKTGYLMIWDKQHRESGWIMEFCSITSSGEFVCLSKETSQPLMVFDLRNTVLRMVGSSAWGRQAIEVVDVASGNPLIYLRASSRSETTAWLSEMQCWQSPESPKPALSPPVPTPDAAAVADNTDSNETAADAFSTGKNPETTTDMRAETCSQPGNKYKNKSELEPDTSATENSATLLLPTQSRKPPQLVQALVHTMAPAAQ
ncbi:hypothetical protein GGF37_005206, partial [Kickxella alabastrina]